jgi:hypothetical protein
MDMHNQRQWLFHRRLREVKIKLLRFVAVIDVRDVSLQRDPEWELERLGENVCTDKDEE